MRDRIQIYIKYSKPCQLNNTKKLFKCPHEMQPIQVSNKIWTQIVKIYDTKISKLSCDRLVIVYNHNVTPLQVQFTFIQSENYCFLTGVDLIGPLKEYKGLKYIATAVCYFSKFVETKAIPAKTGEQVGLFIYELFMRYSVMEVCISDQVKYNYQ